MYNRVLILSDVAKNLSYKMVSYMTEFKKLLGIIFSKLVWQIVKAKFLTLDIIQL